MPSVTSITASLPHLWTHRARVSSLYRSTLRESKKLPHEHLRDYFVCRTRERFRSTKNVRADVVSGRIKSLERDLRRLQATNRGEGLALLRAIEMAFGRRGKLRRQLMLPMTSPSPDAPLIIPQNPKSRLPTYSPTLSILVTSPHGRSSGKAITEPDTINPPILPARAHPGSEDARLLGPFSKRREVNLKRRYWKEQVAAARVPLQSLTESEENGNNRIKWDPEKLFSMLEQAATVPPKSSSPTSSPSVSIPPSPTQTPPPTKFPRPARFLRRRFAEVLAKTPIIKTSGDGRMSVTISPKGIDTTERKSRVRAGPPSEDSMQWIELANTVGKERGLKGAKK